MGDRPRILLTNDDGIDATGLQAAREACAAVGETTVVAPQTDQSGTWRKRSYEFSVEEREVGYAVDGTPSDCVNLGLGGLDAEFDLVVAGCNPGPNFGAHVVEQSGTVGAVKQAGYLGVPAIAVSLYCLPEGVRDFDRADFAEVERFLAAVLPDVLEADSPAFDFANVNVPVDCTGTDPVRVTELAHDCDVRVEATEGGYSRYDPFYDPLRPDSDVPVTDPPGTDRRAIAEGAISVTPLAARTPAVHPDEVAHLVEGYGAVG